MGLFRKTSSTHKEIMGKAIDLVECLVVDSYQRSVTMFEISGELITLLRHYQEKPEPTPTEYELMLRKKNE